MNSPTFPMNHIMNLYNSTMKGILAAKEARRRRMLQQMAAAAVRKAERPADQAIRATHPST